MSNRTWVEKITAGKGNIRGTMGINTDLCYKVRGRDSTGKAAWYFILLHADKAYEFLKHKKGDSYDLADYGEILASGYGEEVPEDLKEMLKEKYGFDNF